ncbi:MAG: hypothetical protein HKN75_02580, partial [Bacteroidia bacterium]|nr:hypothetical protein [Bacteroidia bacterium]
MNLLNPKFSQIFIALIFALLLTPFYALSQNDNPCDCTQRWEEGAHWNSDGSINDAPNAPSENGIIRCGSSAETQSQVGPLANCTYDSASFAIDISSFPCVEPSSGNIVFPLNPTNGQPIIWLNFDVRPDAGSFQIQINDNSGDNVAWALYYSNTITYGVNPNPNGLGVDSISGSCSSLTLAACGVESSSTWNTLPVPNFGVATNYYIAIWDQDADGNVQVNNFKARFGCGDADILLCNVSADTPIAQCDANGTYTLKIPVSGINGEFYAYDPNSNNANGLSSSVCLTNPGANPAVTSDTLILTYNQGIAYNAIIFEATDTLPGISVPNGSCPDPLNPEGCKDTIAGPAPNCCLLVASTNTFNSDCNGADNASILAIGTGGAAPLTYAWSDGQTVAQAMNLSPGTYTVTITDANQCTSTATGSVSEPPALSVLCIVGPNGNISCNGGSDGAISSINTGGTLPYSYQWKDSTGAPIGVNLPIISGLTAGAYTLVVTDGNGCKDSCSVTLTEPTVLTCNIVGEDPDCNGASTGSATVTVGGGTPGYAYLWSDNQTTQIATGLIAGTYTVTVTDANNCTKECTVTLGEPSALSCSAQGTDPLCNGGNDGSAIVTGAGGTQGYTYMWSDNQTTQTATGLTAGTYTATITDANQCTSTCTVVIGEPTAIQTSLTPTSSTCGFANGAVSSNVSGGTPNYTYAWSTGASTANISGVSAGAYSLIVTDANGCKDTMSTSVNDIGGPSVTGSATMVTCNGGHDGTATATAIGGTAGYTYLWSDNQSTQTAIGLFAGTYTVTVTDANQCMASTTIVVNEPSALSCATQGTDPLCNGGNDGSATVTGSGGISPYTYSWSNGQTGSSASGLIAGTYTVVVIDANNCTSTCTVTLGEPSALSCSTQGTDPLCNGGNDGSATVTGAGGTTGYTYMWSDNQTTQTATGLIAGTYTATVTDANQCTSTCTVVIGEPSVLSCSTQGTDPLCNGGNDGSATVAGSGGTSPYAYAWSNGQTGASASGLTAGTFTATVTDANNCTSTCTVTLGEPSAILTTLTPTNSTCGFANGAVSSNVSGGTPNYTYAWSTGATTSNISGVSAGAYSLIVTDANGCKDTMSTSVNDIGGPSVTASGTNLLCNGDSSGTATANPTGGTLGYSYMWSDGQSTQTATGLDAGTYTVTVFDANQCQASTSVTITEPGELMASCSVLNPILCFGDGNGAVVASATGGTPPYCFDWGLSIGNCSDSLENLGAGNYGVLITDANGCTATCTVTLGEPSLL